MLIPDIVTDIFRLFVRLGYRYVKVNSDCHSLTDKEIKIIIKGNNVYIYYTYGSSKHCIVMERSDNDGIQTK